MGDFSDNSLENLTTIHDELVSDGIIVYGPYESVKYVDQDYPMEFRICPALSTKPHSVGAKNVFDSSRPWGPGSDMFCPSEKLIVAQLNGTHDLALNLFCVDRPQLLMLTLDSYKRQYQPLDQDDLAVMLEVLQRYPNMYTIFNGGEKAGCSRVHKHLQGLIGPPHAFDLVIDSAENNTKTRVPYQYFTYHFPQGFNNVSATNALAVYSSLLKECREATGVLEPDSCPHNVVMWKDWIILIPRRAGIFEGASANAGGMMGSVWVTDQESIDKWLRSGISNILRGLGVPSYGQTSE